MHAMYMMRLKKNRGVYTITVHWNLKISTTATTVTLHSTSENSMLEKFQKWVEHWQKSIACDRHYWEKINYAKASKWLT